VVNSEGETTILLPIQFSSDCPSLGFALQRYWLFHMLCLWIEPVFPCWFSLFRLVLIVSSLMDNTKNVGLPTELLQTLSFVWCRVFCIQNPAFRSETMYWLPDLIELTTTTTTTTITTKTTTTTATKTVGLLRILLFNNFSNY